MTRFRLLLLALMTISFVLPPSASTAQLLTVRKALVLPLSGAGADGVTFEGTVAVQRFVHRDGEVFAIGAVSGSLSGPAGPIGTSLYLPVVFPVDVGPGRLAREERGFIDPASSAPDYGARLVLAQAQTCGVLHLELGAVNLNLLGAVVATMPVTIDINGDMGGPLGTLVCAILRTLNTVAALVNLLNSLLGLVTGLLGGLTGALPI
jgi:hypothetical protein